MAIDVHLDRVMLQRKVKSRDLAAWVGITEANLSLLKSGKVKGVRFSTLEAICQYLQCQPGDILVYVPDGLASSPAGANAGAVAQGPEDTL